MRISEENENSQGTANNQPPSQSRPQTPFCLKFPKTARLRSRKDYRRVYQANRRVHGQFISIDFFMGNSPRPKLGITVSRKFGKANKRNHFKRLVREAFRENQSLLPSNLEINIAPRPDLTAPTKKGILEDLSLIPNAVKNSSFERVKVSGIQRS